MATQCQLNQAIIVVTAKVAGWLYTTLKSYHFGCITFHISKFDGVFHFCDSGSQSFKIDFWFHDKCCTWSFTRWSKQMWWIVSAYWWNSDLTLQKMITFVVWNVWTSVAILDLNFNVVEFNTVFNGKTNRKQSKTFPSIFPLLTQRSRTPYCPFGSKPTCKHDDICITTLKLVTRGKKWNQNRAKFSVPCLLAHMWADLWHAVNQCSLFYKCK